MKMSMKISRDEFLEQFSVVWSMRYDLPDVMLEELREIRSELKEMKKEDDYADLAEMVNSFLREEGFPDVFAIEKENGNG